MTGNPDESLTIDTHHHILPDFFWQAAENAHAPVGGLAPLRWSKEASIDVAVVSLSAPGMRNDRTHPRRPAPPLFQPALFTPTPKAAKRVLEFFTARINNDHGQSASGPENLLASRWQGSVTGRLANIPTSRRNHCFSSGYSSPCCCSIRLCRHG